MFYRSLRTTGRCAATAVLAVGQATPSLADDGVHAVSDAFHGLLNEILVGTAVAVRIAPLWLEAEDVSAMHPIGGCDIGQEAALGAFDGFANLAEGSAARIDDQKIAVFGDTAIETGVERGRAVPAGQDMPLEYRVTNVYVRTEDGWRMVHHHTDQSTPMIELLAQHSE